MPDIVLKNILGQEVVYPSIDTVKLKNTAGEEETFSYGVAVENVPIELDLANGEQQTIYAPDGTLVKSAVVSITGGGGDAVEMEETELPFAAADGAYQAMLPITRLFFNATYTVMWNGTEYSCTCKAMEFADSLVLVVGNAAFLGGEAEDVPFLIVQTPDIVGCITLEANATNTVGLTLSFDAGGTDNSVLYSILDKSITEFADETIQTLGSYAFYYCQNLVSINLPNLKTAGGYAFYYNTALQKVNMPSLEDAGTYLFRFCSALTHIELPSLLKVSQYMIDASNVSSVKIPAATAIDAHGLRGANALESVDTSVLTSIGNTAFFNDFALKTLILRNAGVVCTAGTNIFGNCYHFLGTKNSPYNPTGAKDGYIYVPSALLNSYKVATNWSTYASQFRALEDYTVDGTITGELDTSKI